MTAAGERPRHWLKTLGRQGRPLDADWLAGAPERRRVTYFPRRPRMQRGDGLVLYAAGWQAVFAVGEVSSDGALAEASPSSPARWPWAIHMRLHLLVPDLTFAPAVETIGVIPRSLSQHSHISITEAQYRRAVEALADAARRW